jgi:hypothetical protein
MARKRIAISTAGGIAAGAPFVLDAALFVQQAAPAVANTGRWARVADAVQSLVAPDVLAPADLTSFVVGSGSTSRGRPSTIVVGTNVKSSGDASAQRNILIGTDLDPGAASANFNLNIVIGGLSDLSQTAGSVISIGYQQARSGAFFIDNAILLGRGLTVSGGSCVGIGGFCLVGGECVVIGQAAIATGSQVVVIGKDATASNTSNGVAIGRRARTSDNAISIGFFCDSLGGSGISIGRDASDGGFAACVVIGRQAVATAANQCRVGSVGFPVTDVNFVGSKLSWADGVVTLGQTLAAPAGNPASGYFLFVDPADGNLKARGTAGTITTLAVP